ncbi:MAG: MFS transporter [Clostridiales Family XIII bacterium]|nr:MFS transporter [Clostridiales Family XIII bacterium]
MNTLSEQKFSNSFKLLLAGQIVTLFGSALLRFVLSLYVLDITGRADIFAVLFAISTMPLLLSPIGGAIADRVNRRNMMVAIDFVNGVVVLGFILISYFGDLSVFMIGACMVLLGFTSAMESPTVLACVPAVAPAEKLEQANGIIQGIGSLAQTVAPILGGVLYGIFGMKPLVIFGCIAFFTASFIEIFIRMPFEKRPHEGHIIPMILGDTKE